jgi:hypothetical protein
MLLPVQVIAQVIVTPAVSWSGKKFVSRENEGGERLLTDHGEFAAVWKAWRKAEEVPVIDFPTTLW